MSLLNHSFGDGPQVQLLRPSLRKKHMVHMLRICHHKCIPTYMDTRHKSQVPHYPSVTVDSKYPMIGMMI